MPSLTISLSLKSSLRSSTRGDSYGLLDFNPDLVFDFKSSYYRKGGASTTFSSAITHAASSNATMVDSDGLLKWRPHNLLTHSGDLTGGDWGSQGLTVATGQNDFAGNPTAFKVTPTAVSGPHRLYKSTSGSRLSNGTTSTVAIDVKADGYNFFSISCQDQTYAVINLSDGTVSLDTGSVSPTVTSLGNGWYRCSITSSVVTQEVLSVGETSQALPFGSQSFTGDGTSGVLVAYPHSFRSDLGGMVNNPDTANSYVPTTSAVVYAPRRGHHVYSGSAWVNEGILHESEARTNLLPDSSVLGYSRINIATSTSTVVSPSGLQDAVLVRPTVATGITWVYLVTVFNTGVVTTISTFAKASGKPFVAMSNSNGSVVYASFNLTTGAVGTVTSGYTANMEDFGNGWYRCSVTTPTGFNERGIYAVSDTDGAIAAAANGNDGILLYGAQVEAGAFLTSYIPTTGAPATRAIDIAEIPTSAFGYNNGAGSIAVEFKSNKPSSLSYGAFVLSDGGVSNRILHFTSSTAHRGAIITSGVADVNIGAGSRGAPSELVKFAIGFSDNNFATSLNGATAVTDTSVTIPSGISKLGIGYYYPTNVLSNLINGYIKSIQYYPRRLTDTQLQELTT